MSEFKALLRSTDTPFLIEKARVAANQLAKGNADTLADLIRELCDRLEKKC